MRIPCSTPAGSKHTAFTLIEMLVVIAIIAIIASLLMPALMRSLDIARSVHCTNNLKLLGVSLTAYTEDNHGRSLKATANDYNSQKYSWMGYLGSFYMGIDDWNSTSYLPKDLRCLAGNAFGYCYGMNTYFAAAIHKKGMTYMRKPSKTIVFGDGGYWNNGGTWSWSYTFGTNRWKQYYKFRHFNSDGKWEMNGVMNVLFGDMHVDNVGSQWGMLEERITTPHETCRLLNPWYPDDYCNQHPGSGGKTSP